MNLQPTLIGKLIKLRPLTTEDHEALFLAASDPLIWQLHPEPTRYQCPEFQRYLDSAMACKGAFVIIDLKTNEIIGCSRYYDFKDDLKQVVVGFTFLTRTYWGGTYNHELKELMLKHAFQFVESVIFYVGSTNFRSQRALLKIGAELLGNKDEYNLTFKITQTTFI